MRPATVVTIVILLLALMAAGIYQLMNLDTTSTETTVAAARTAFASLKAI